MSFSKLQASYSLNDLRLHVNMNFLYLLYDFIMDGIDIGFSNIPTVEKFEQILIECEPIIQATHTIKEFKLENPQLIFYENQNNFKASNSLIANQKEIYVKFESFETVENIDINIIECSIKLKTFKIKENKNKSAKFLILSPTSLFLNGTIKANQEYQTKSETFEINLPEINVNMTQLVFNSFLNVVKSINHSFYRNQINEKTFVQLKEPKESNESVIKYESLFKPLAFDACEFWFTKPNEKTEESDGNETLPSISSKDRLKQSTKTELKIKAPRINFQLESDQVPLLRMHLAINEGSIKNWLNEPSLHLVICMELAYFNQVKVVWEPVIEKIENDKEELKLYEFSIDMITNNHIFEEINFSETISNSSNFPIRTFSINSSNNFQFVITRTFFNLIDTITNNYVILNGEKNEIIEENYDELKMEENNLMKMLENGDIYGNEEDLTQADLNIEDSDSDEESDNAVSPSFKTLIKNELGFDISLESISGFRVRL